MTTAPISATLSWHDLNQRALVREFALLRRRLGDENPSDPFLAASAEPMSEPAAIDNLCAIFDLSPFERELLLLCAGVEMDSALADRCANLLGGGPSRPARGLVTFSLAMAMLDNPHWSAISASGPLRHFRLLTLEPGNGLTSGALHVDERVLHYIAGTNRLDPHFEDLLFLKPPPQWMDADHLRLATETLGGFNGETRPAQILHLCGDDPLGQESVASLLAHRSGRELYVLRHEDTPAAGEDLEQFLHLWMRERLLVPAFLLLQWGNYSPSAAARQLAERIPGPLIIASREPLRLHRAVESFQVDKPGPAAQQRLWQDALGVAPETAPAQLGNVAQQFRLSTETIVSIAASVAAAEPALAEAVDAPSMLVARLWNACQLHTRPRLEGFAERIVPRSTWDDLVLPEPQKLVLRQIAAQSRNRMTVYETWGFAARGLRGLGISALFAGPSGTGKTLAAEVLAAELLLDLYRIDLSAVVSKYIGETEKNLKQVFDAAESGGCLLLFDEADALFGKRAEVKTRMIATRTSRSGIYCSEWRAFRGWRF